MSITDQIKSYCTALDHLDCRIWITNQDGEILFDNLLTSISKDFSTSTISIFNALSLRNTSENISPVLPESQKRFFSEKINKNISAKPFSIPGISHNLYIWQEELYNKKSASSNSTHILPTDIEHNYHKNNAIIDALPDMIVRLDKFGKYVDVRPPAHLRDELDIYSIIGKTLHQMLPVRVADLAISKIDTVLKTGKMEVFNYTIPKNEKKKHYEARMVPCCKNEVLTIIRDITKRWDAEEALAASEERFRLLAENARDMIFRISLFPKKNVEYVSPICEHILGYTPENFYNDPELDYHMIHHEDRVKLDNGSIINEDDDKPIVLRWVCKNGDVVYVEQKWVPIFDTEGKLIAIEGICRDITERIRAHEEKVKLEAELYQAQKMQAIGQLAGGVAHDFNNLLTGIVGNIELAMMDLPKNSTAVEYLNESRQAVKLATDLSVQMLAYSGKGHFHLQELDLSREVKSMKLLIDSYVNSHISINLDLLPDLPTIQADHNQIQQIIMSLVNNAAEAIDKNSGSITIRTGEVKCDKSYKRTLHIDGEMPSGMCSYIEVRDNGCGMDIETREKMFEPFFSTKFTGRGLGLSAVLGIVTGHKGGIVVTTELGKGTTVRIVFPQYNENHSVPSVEKPMYVNQHKTVLVVDDERLIRHVAKQTLLKYGYHVILASDGREAVEIYKKRQQEIDLILLDLTMPNMNGEEAFYELKKMNEAVPILLASGFSENIIRERFSEQSPSNFLQKPFTPGDLNSAIEKVFHG